MKTLIDKKTTIKNAISNIYSDNIFRIAGTYYPGYNSWLREKVIPGLFSNERKVITITDEGCISAYALIKQTPNEKKLCTIIVHPKYRNNGYGSILIDATKLLLDTEYPYFTVPEELITLFNPLIKRNNFTISDIVSDEYRPNKKEYHINKPTTFA